MMRLQRAACLAVSLAAGLVASPVGAQTPPPTDGITTDTGTPAPPIIPVLPAAPAFQAPTAAPASPPPPSPSVLTAPPVATPAPPADPAAPAIAAWQSRPVVELQALDKVTAQTVKLTGRIGDTLGFGSLTIRVEQCLAAPPDQRQDATAFLDIADKTGVPGFRGWMFAAEPGVAMLEHPLYDIRLTGCHA